MTPSIVRASGVDFTYFEAGQGPLVLCMHGFPDTAWSFVLGLKKLGRWRPSRGGAIHAKPGQ